MSSLEARLKEQARRLGFDRAGIAPATPSDGFDRLREWLDAGYAGEMTYLRDQSEARRLPSSILPNVRSVLMVALNYLAGGPGAEGPLPPGAGRVARYARGADYHRQLWDRLNELAAWLEADQPGCRACGVADTAPLLERDFARRAGLGWVGKNTMLIDTRLGSYFFLGALLTDTELVPDPPRAADHCGTCTACLDACPTAAFPSPRVLDARRCISYLTIELKTAVPDPMRTEIGDWVFGCDVCQEVCPWNRKAPPTGATDLLPRADLETLDLIELLGLSEDEFRRRFKKTALFRARRRGLVRNACLVLGNRSDPTALPALRRALADAEPLVREAAAWAIAAIEGRQL